MLQSDTYYSIAGESRGFYREKASKFIAFAYQVSAEELVKECLTLLRKEYFDANHHCYAYRIGYPVCLYRTHDDGEPSGSAGKPIYGQILSKDLSDVLVVVIRYFGGTKLGIPGLIHAYRTAAKDALDQATIITRTISDSFHISFPYVQLNAVMQILKKEGAILKAQSFDQTCDIHFSIRKSKSEVVRNKLSKLINISIYQ
ncbi:MAG: YigZ family protein [bacterium]